MARPGRPGARARGGRPPAARRRGETTRAAHAAIGLGFLLMLRGDLAAVRPDPSRPVAAGAVADEVARWYVVQLDAESALHGGDVARSLDLARRVRDAAQRATDPTLLSLALMTEGTARLRSGAVAEGMSLLDEAMLPVTAGRIPPDMAGNLYCQMIAVCWELFDLRRVREWTAATERWCAQFDTAVMFTGICRMHRVQLRQVSGEWDVAADDARVVCPELAGMNTQVVAEGHYLLGELLRLRGDVVVAESAYLRRTSSVGTRSRVSPCSPHRTMRSTLASPPSARPLPATRARSTRVHPCCAPWSTSPSRSPTWTRPVRPANSSPRWRTDGLRGPVRRGGPCAWGGADRLAGSREASSLFARPSAAGRSWRRRTRARAHGCCWRRRTRRWRTTAPRPRAGRRRADAVRARRRGRPPTTPAAASGCRLPGGLTVREAEILRQVALGAPTSRSPTCWRSARRPWPAILRTSTSS